jgi:hypothetical protein
MKVVFFYTGVVITKNVNLWSGDTGCFQVFLDLFQVIQVGADVVVSSHTVLPLYLALSCRAITKLPSLENSAGRTTHDQSLQIYYSHFQARVV